MTIQDAIKSGKPFRLSNATDGRWIIREGDKLFKTWNPADKGSWNYRPTTFKISEILETVWEVKSC